MDLQEAKRLAYEILQHLGEELPRVMTDPILEKDMRGMAYNIANASDETILGFEQAQSRTTIFLMGLYNELLIVFYVSWRSSWFSSRPSSFLMNSSLSFPSQYLFVQSY
jgi:hypothetical protein